MGLIRSIIRCFCCCEVADDELYVEANFQNHKHLLANRNTSANDYQQYLSNIQKSGNYKSGTSGAFQQNRASSQSSLQKSGKCYSGTSDVLEQNRARSQSSLQKSEKCYSGTSDALQQNRGSSQSSLQKSEKCYLGTSDTLQQNSASSQSSLKKSGKCYLGTSDELQQNKASSQSSLQKSGKCYSGTSDALQQNIASSQSSLQKSGKCNLGTSDALQQNRASSKSSLQKSGKRYSGKEDVVKNVVIEEKWIKWYSSCQRILVVGDGDFSFSASLAKAFVSAPNMIATSLDSREFLRKNYPQALSNIQDLGRRGCTVIHGMDCTKMSKNGLLANMRFDRVVFNFPFAGFFKKKSREYQLCLHQKLVSQFMENAKKLISKKGEIHITHKANSFHRDWNLEHLGVLQGLRLIEAVHFNQNEYPGYTTKTGFGGDNNFNCNPSKTYKFCLRNC